MAVALYGSEGLRSAGAETKTLNEPPGTERGTATGIPVSRIILYPDFVAHGVAENEKPRTTVGHDARATSVALWACESLGLECLGPCFVPPGKVIYSLY